MSQNDFVIANASGASVRSDINSALQALASLSSGTAAPGTTYPNQLWHDETNDQLKIRDEANTSWIIIASKVGTTWTPYWQGTAQGNMSTLTYGAIAQALIMSAKQIEGAKATVASATTPNLVTAAANGIELTGTTQVNGYTLGQAGTLYYVEYTGAGLTLQHNATSHILPTGANISAAAGDSWFIFSRGSNNARIFGYQRADGTALGGAIATQSEVEAASLNTKSVSPGRMQYHPGVAKFFASIDCTGTFATRTSHNLTSTTDNGSGRCQLNIATDFSTADWISTAFNGAIVVGNLAGAYSSLRSTDMSAMTAGTIEYQIGNAANGAPTDVDGNCFAGFGDQ